MSAPPTRRLYRFPTASVMLLPAALLLCLSLVLVMLQPWQLELAVGGDRETGRREDDAPYLSGVFASEPADNADQPWYAAPTAPYRWTSDRMVLTVPGAGSGTFVTALTVAAQTPDGSPTTTVWSTDDWRVVLDLPHGGPRRYQWLVRADGNFTLTLESATVRRDTDPRLLGVVLSGVKVTAASGLHLPDGRLLAQLLLWLTALLVILLRLEIPARWTVAVLPAAALLPALFAWLGRTSFAAAVPLLLIGSIGGALLLSVPMVRFAPRDLRYALSLSVLAVTVRLIGLLHPHAIDSDVGFHANNLLRVTFGWLQLTAGLPAEAGGGLSPYPSGVYLLLAPLQLLLPTDDAARRLLMTVTVALLDGAVPFAIWWWLRRCGADAVLALFAAALTVVQPPLLEALSIGEYANVAGQALALPALLAMAPLLRTDHVSARQYVGWILLLMAGLLMHSGVTLSLGVFVTALLLVSILLDRQAVIVYRLLPGALLAAVGALLLFYSAPAYLQLVAMRSTLPAGVGQPFAAVAADTLLALVGLEAPQQRGLRLPLGLGAAALVVVVVPRLASTLPPAVHRLTLAAVLTVLISNLLLLVAGQGLRWAMFAAPWLAVAAAVVLSRIAARPRLRPLALLLLLAMLADGLVQWFGFVRDYLH